MRPKLDILTSLRFFAAITVVLFHCGQSSLSFLPQILRAIINSGYEAVIFFFVLSGFVLAYNYAQYPLSSIRNGSLEFWKNRFARIYPMYFVALLIALPRYLYSLKIGTIPHGNAASLIVVPLLLQSWFSEQIAGAINLPAWSLSVEAFFYLCFPFILRLTRAVGLLKMMCAAYCMILLVNLPKFAHDHPYFPVYHLPSFIVGIGAGILFQKHRPAPRRLEVFLVAASLFGVLGFRDILPAVFISQVILVPLFATLIFWAASCTASFTAIAWTFLVLLGEASYCLYILHLPVYWLFLVFMKKLGESVEGNIFALLAFVVMLTLTSVLAHIHLELRMKSLIIGKLMTAEKLAQAVPA